MRRSSSAQAQEDSVQASERTNLIASDNNDPTAASQQSSEAHTTAPDIVPPKRITVVMEPLMLLFCMAFQGLSPLISQYVYYRIGAEMDAPVGANDTRTVNEWNNASSVEAAVAAATRHFVGTDSQCLNASNSWDNATSSAQYEATQRIQDRASTWILYRDVLAASGATLSIPVISSASDRLGRRPALIGPCLGTLFESLVSLCVIWFHLPLSLMLVAAVCSCLCGGIGCLFASALAYLADVTSVAARPMRITVLEAVTGVGGAATSVLIGWWIRWQGYLMPHAFCTILYLLAALFCIFLVPEVRRPKQINEAKDEQPSRLSVCLGVLLEPVGGIASLMSQPDGLPVVYGLVLSGIFLYCAAFFGTMDLSVLYSMNYPFCLDSVLIGYYSAAKQLTLQLGMLLVVWLCRPALSTLTIASLGLVSTAAGSVLMAIAWNRIILWASIAAAVAAACPVPMQRAFLSMVTPSDKQGCMFSVFGVLQMLAYLVGNVAYTSGYKATLMWQPGFVFYTVAATSLVSLLLTSAAQLVYRKQTRRALDPTAATNVVVCAATNDGQGLYGSIQNDA